MAPTPTSSGGDDQALLVQEMLGLLSSPAAAAFVRNARSFQSSVEAVAGEVGSVPVDPPPEPTVDGYCYLCLARPDGRALMHRAIGFNPWMGEVWAWLQVNVGVWATGRFSVEYGVPPLSSPDDRRHFLQAHLEPDEHGLTIRELLYLQTAHTRLGASGGRQETTSSQAPATGHSQLVVATPAPLPVVKVPFYATLEPGSTGARLSPRTDKAVVALTKYFESVRLEGFEMSLNITGGRGVVVAFGVNTGSVIPDATTGFLAFPMSTMYSGDDSCSSVGVFTLPPDHGFGTEVKAVSVGNPDPVFTWRANATDPFVVTVRGVLSLRLTGAGVATPFAIPAYK